MPVGYVFVSEKFPASDEVLKALEHLGGEATASALVNFLLQNKDYDKFSVQRALQRAFDNGQLSLGRKMRLRAEKGAGAAA